jgi:PKD repeat protein
MISYCQQNQIGWLAWSWGYVVNGDCAEMDMTRGGDFSTLTGWGLVVATTDPNSIKNTAVRSPYMVNGACNGVMARIAADKISGPMPLTVAFDGSGSVGTGLTYAWTFGDGATSAAQKPQHTYTAGGSYKVKLTVSNGSASGSDSITITAIDPSKEPLEISCGKTAIASSSESGTVGAFPAANAVDCNPGTRWASNTTDNEWIYVDLGQAMTFGRVILRWETAYASSYKLQTSNDAQAWTDKATITSGNGGNDTIDVTATARYVRMLGVTRGTQYGYSLYEFEMYQMPGATVLLPHAMISQPAKFVWIAGRSMIITDIKGRTVNRPGFAVSELGAGLYCIHKVPLSCLLARRVIVEEK